jgi:hypothetical protein
MRLMDTKYIISMALHITKEIDGTSVQKQSRDALTVLCQLRCPYIQDISWDETTPQDGDCTLQIIPGTIHLTLRCLRTN